MATLKQILHKYMNSTDFNESICLRIKENYCSEGELKLVFRTCLKFLSQNSPTKRLRCLTLISELTDFKCFRLLVIELLDEILSLVFEPYACTQGKLLKQKALTTLKKWHTLYPKTPQLIIAYARFEKIYDFSHEAIYFPAQAESSNIDPRQVRRNQEKAEIAPKIHEVIHEINSCFKLLERENLSNISKLESSENKILFDTLRSSYKAAKKYHRLLCKIGAPDLKALLEIPLLKARGLAEITLVPESDDSDSDEEFEKVDEPLIQVSTPSPASSQNKAPKLPVQLPLAEIDSDEVMYYETGFEHVHRGWIKPPDEPDAPKGKTTKRVHAPPSEIPKESRPCLVRNFKGVLCQRKDYETCPFHGKIIPRDEHGIALDPGVAEAERYSDKRRSKKPLWELIDEDVQGAFGSKKRKTSAKCELEKNIKRLNSRN